MFHLHGISLQLQELIELRLEGAKLCQQLGAKPGSGCLRTGCTWAQCYICTRPLTPLSKVRFGTLRVHLSEFLLGKIIIPEF